MNKIKIAICLSGEPRYWDLGSSSIASFIKQHKADCDIDVFYHFWNTITKRQSHLIHNPIIQTIDENILYTNYKPTVGICENKDALNYPINVAWEYIQKLIKQHNIEHDSLRESLRTKDDFSKSVKTTNCPPYSQLISMCKSFTCMTDYAEKNNINYDIIIRSRSDIEISPIPTSKLHSIVRKDKLSRYIQFPSISIRKSIEHQYTPFIEYCFFVSSSNILNKSVFENYSNKIVQLLFNVKTKNNYKKTTISYLSSHNCVPLFLRQNKKTELGAPISGFKYKLKQMPLERNIHVK